MDTEAFEVDCVVIGAGVVGLACARAVAMAGRTVLALEAASAPGTETSSRNSEVIHAGLYYPPDSLMARTCVAGSRRLYAYCEAHGIAARAVGKLIVATDSSEEAELEAIARNASRSGVDTLEPVSRARAQALEPALRCSAALFSPRTGIVDSHAYMLALQGEAEAHGAQFAFHAPVTEARREDDGAIRLHVAGVHDIAVRAPCVINAAGLRAVEIARLIAGPYASLPTARYARGVYFSLRGPSPFRHLIYPVPVPGGLGIHLTLDMNGRARFGPDVEWIDRVDYGFDPSSRIDGFRDAIRRYYPGLPADGLVPDYCGIRPKISGPGEPRRDFRIDGPEEHGVTGLVNLLGIESPGLTASLELADLAVERLFGRGDR